MSKIIVVDDDPTNITLTKMLLELDGFTVLTSPDIEQAKSVCDSTTDAFLIDCHLARGVSGLDLVRDIRAGKTLAPGNAVIIVTSGDYRRETESQEAGADMFLFKPYPPETLSSRLNELLSAKGKR